MQHISVTNILDQLVLILSPNAPTSSFDISELPSGMYTVRVNNMIAGRFIKE